MTNQIFIVVWTLALPCFLEMALCRSDLYFWHFKITLPIFMVKLLTTPWSLLICTVHKQHLGSEWEPVGKQTKRDLRRANPFVGWYLLLQLTYTGKSIHYTFDSSILINSSFNNAGSSSEYKYHTAGRYMMSALESM